MEGTTAVDGGELMGINTNYGDKVRGKANYNSDRDLCVHQATYSNNCFPKTECQGYTGCDKSKGECEPKKAGKC